MTKWTARSFGLWNRSIIVAFLLITHTALLLTTIRRTYITVDEVMNVAAGVSYWHTGRFFIYRVNPPLTKLISVLPVLVAAPETDWTPFEDIPTQRTEFQVGVSFTKKNTTRIFSLIRLSRLIGIAWSVLGGWLIFRWTRELYGDRSGYMALSLWCFEPYILGHAALATSDVPAAVAGLMASYTFWKQLKRPSWGSAILAGIFLGIAVLTKFTLLVLYPLWMFLWIAGRWVSRWSKPRPYSMFVEIVQFLLIIFASLDLINLGYICSGTGIPLGEYPFVSRFMTGVPTHSIGNRFRGTWLGRLPVPLPEDFLRGIDTQRVDFEGTRMSYLAGKWEQTGWWYYYLYALAVKEPLGTLALVSWGLTHAIFGYFINANRRRRLDILSVLAPSIAILVLVSSQVGYTQHSRYIIPALPYLMINAGRLVNNRLKVCRPWMQCVAWVLLVGAALSSLRIYPHSLSYFNEAAGGPLRGHNYLVDSNIDWGQDLIYLKEWIEYHPEARPLRLAYYNFYIDPSLVGLVFELPPPGPESLATGVEVFDPRAVGPQPGYYAISVNFLRGSDFPIANGQGKFRQIRPHEFEYFRYFDPIAHAGYSINIYHITAEEADIARRVMGLPPLRQIVPKPEH